MTSKREEEFQRLVSNYESLGDRRDWDGTNAAGEALERFGAEQNKYGEWVLTEPIELEPLIIWMASGGVIGIPVTEYTTIRRTVEAAKNAINTYWGELREPLQWVESVGGVWRAYGEDNFEFQVYPFEVKE